MGHGGNVLEAASKSGRSIRDIIDFSASINDFMEINDIIIKKDQIKIYPQGLKIKNKSLCEFNDVLPVPGLTFFIHRLLSYINGNIIIVEPTFNEYKYAFTHGIRINLPFNLINNNPEILNNYNFSLIIIVYPDNPLGNLISRDSLLTISEICRKKSALLFIDESFIFFLKNRYNEDDLLNGSTIIGRSLTKILGVPSLRIGYIATDDYNMKISKKITGPWSVPDYVIDYINSIKLDYHFLDIMENEKSFMINNMEAMGFRAAGDHSANFITFMIPDFIDAHDFYSYLIKNGILVRLLDDYECLGEQYIRIGIRRHEFNIKLVNAIRGFLNENDSGSRDLF
ncbi:aminotransferase class I/II-fold pyridoxal phosphate-dependent enzyme [Picrophilus oshimae]|uniref:Histidinol-phosphate aminotransferase n=1 Tax=Picrophilus torridus (strain ATCC 700027 / DSM 9790 / JCM 10055 / NBRC 100828 / KAW 2/3) TaxID=1122961 RepID=Q6L0V4_PICTO|nr:aminotransferase class I/II-fold pyridoxal phosphate-dependent enzyme [Picrophilus oshimae]AAT43398.1 histidinol-phosphate aminotransferase [Picrophilus oshimae DSM 9789]